MLKAATFRTARRALTLALLTHRHTHTLGRSPWIIYSHETGALLWFRESCSTARTHPPPSMHAAQGIACLAGVWLSGAAQEGHPLRRPSSPPPEPSHLLRPGCSCLLRPPSGASASPPRPGRAGRGQQREAGAGLRVSGAKQATPVQPRLACPGCSPALTRSLRSWDWADKLQSSSVGSQRKRSR